MIPSWGCDHRQSLGWKDRSPLDLDTALTKQVKCLWRAIAYNNITLSTVIKSQIFVSYFLLLKLRTKLQFPGCQKSLISKKWDISHSDLIISSRSRWLCRLWCQIIPDVISWIRTGDCFKDSLDQPHSTSNLQSNTCVYSHVHTHMHRDFLLKTICHTHTHKISREPGLEAMDSEV